MKEFVLIISFSAGIKVLTLTIVRLAIFWEAVHCSSPEHPITVLLFRLSSFLYKCALFQATLVTLSFVLLILRSFVTLFHGCPTAIGSLQVPLLSSHVRVSTYLYNKAMYSMYTAYIYIFIKKLLLS